MIAGFALVAWPAEWGDTGVMTFIVNQQGKVYQKNLGSEDRENRQGHHHFMTLTTPGLRHSKT
jgi:hypothetical protein